MRMRLGSGNEKILLVLAGGRLERHFPQTRIRFYDALIVSKPACWEGCKVLYSEDLGPGQLLRFVCGLFFF